MQQWKWVVRGAGAACACAGGVLVLSGTAHAADGQEQQRGWRASPLTGATPATPPPGDAGATTQDEPPRNADATDPSASQSPPSSDDTSNEDTSNGDSTGSTPSGASGDAAASDDGTPNADATGGAAGDGATGGAAGDGATGTDPTGVVPGSDPNRDQTKQDATVIGTGTAGANSGGNVALAGNGGTGSNGAVVPSGTGGTATGTITTGTSGASGGSSSNAISQQAQATTTGNGEVDILQVALVINIGLGAASSGRNTVVASAVPGQSLAHLASARTGASGAIGLVPARARTAVATGNAKATGNNTITAVAQVATVQGPQGTQQIATVVNVGIGLGNTGVNIAVGTIRNGATGAGAPVSAASGVGTGNARATGNQSTTQIVQIAIGSAQDDSALQIVQRAVVVNMGLGVANTGGNSTLAVGGLDALSGLDAAQRATVTAVLDALLGLGGSPSATSPGAGGALAGAQVTTGSADAVGNHSTTGVLQMVSGATTGTAQASALQDAGIANVGIGVANSGLNAAVSGVSGTGSTVAPQISTQLAPVLQFLSLVSDPTWLTSDHPVESLATSIVTGGLELDFQGSLRATDLTIALTPDIGDLTGTAGPGVHVRQISGVLDVSIAIADTGNNTVVTIVGQDSRASRAGIALPGGDTLSSVATIRTGNATAIGHQGFVDICQTIGVGSKCVIFTGGGGGTGSGSGSNGGGPSSSPSGGGTTTPTHEATIAPANVGGAATVAPAAADVLPFTGSGDAAPLAGFGALLTAIGAALAGTRRRRRRV